ncbi:MAG: outer membrane beta-barrel protein [Opitutales bacterium]|nr:outer membrane beta-barrel protein [Opitutales bacterium]
MSLRTILLTLVGFLSLTICSAEGPVMLGENSSLNMTIGGAIQYNDNVFLDSVDKESDTILVFSPGLELNFGQEPSNAHVKLVYVHDFISYSDNTRLNRDNPDIKLDGLLKSVKSNVDFGVSYKENSQNDANNNLTGDLATRNILTAHVNGEWSMSAKSSLAGGYNLEDVQYDDARFYDRESYSIPINYYWAVTPKLDASVGYRYRNTSYDPDGVRIRQNPQAPDLYRSDTDDQFFNVGVRGAIGAKTTGEIRVGIQERDFNTPGVEDEDLLSVDARAVWQATEKSNLSVLFSRDFNADSFGTSIESSDFQVGGSTALQENLTGFANIRFSKDDYQGGRSDDGLYGQVGVSFSPSSNTAVSVAYVIYNNNSDFIPADFDNNVFNISGTLRF